MDVAPAFADAANGDYTLRPASGLIDAGAVIPGINDDYVGSAPDIGAYEHQSPGTYLPLTLRHSPGPSWRSP